MAELRRNADGFLMCSSCGEGRCRTELDQARSEAASEADSRELSEEQARFDAGDV